MGLTAAICAVALSASLTVAQGNDDLERKLVAMYLRNGIAELGLDAATPEGRDKIARLERGIREDLRDRQIVEAEAIRRGLPITAHLDARRERWIARFGGPAGYRAYLTEHRLTEAEFDRVIAQEIAGELLRDALTRDIRVDEAEVRAFYERERSNPELEGFFVEPEKVRAAHILIAARRGLHEDIDARREKAERIRRELLQGADFAALARQHSDDPATRERGGDLGAFTRDTHTEAFDRMAFSLTPGETSPVVQTEYGFHVIRVVDRTPRRVRTIEELRPAITRRLIEQKIAAHLRTWLAERRAEIARPAGRVDGQTVRRPEL